MKQSNPPKILGSFEPVTFPEFGISDITAKIDTGADTGALHCTKIRLEEAPNGKVLAFSPFDHPEIEIRAESFAVKYVRSSNGDRQERFFIDTTIEIHGNKYPIALSLADRSDMKWPVLIGRRFLHKHNFLVDVSKVKP